MNLKKSLEQQEKKKTRRPPSSRSPSKASQLPPYPSPAFPLCLLHSLQSRGQTPKQETNERARIMQVIAQVSSVLFTPSKNLSTAQKIEVCAPACGLLRAGDKIA